MKNLDLKNKRILDPCCGGRMMWRDRQNPDVVFGDIRHETLTVTDCSHGNPSGTRTLRIEPDTLIDFRSLPYPDGSFKLIAFDPPHLVRAGPRSWLAANSAATFRTSFRAKGFDTLARLHESGNRSLT